MIIREDDVTGAQIRALLTLHLSGMAENSPPESVFALGIEALRASDITVWAAWEGDDLLGCGALRHIAPDHGEVKSMRTAPGHLRKGAASAILEYIVAAARTRGYRRLSLETGSGPAFDPALTLYRRHGFRNGPAFGEYVGTSFNQFLHLDL
ncbi:MAG: GNAT family N-acetyltransferase [Sphingobium sp.]